MAEKVVEINDKKKKRLNSKRIAAKYPRIDRECSDLRPEHIIPQKRQYNPPDIEGFRYAVTKEEPCEGYQLEYKADLGLELRIFNSVLLYRMMKMMYGEPDIVGAYIKSQETPETVKTIYLGAGVNWSYTLDGGCSILIEIRSKNSNTIFEIMIWDKQQSITDVNYKSLAEKFLIDIDGDIEKNKHLFDHNDTNNTHTSIQNIFAFQYKSADDLLLLAQIIDLRPEPREYSFNEFAERPHIVVSSGSIYCSAALFYIMSFESLLGILYKILKRDEYKSVVYDRLTTRADMPSRLLSMQHYCNGFTRQIIDPGSDEWNQFELLREYRNNIVHGNLDEDHHFYCLNEDGLQFYCGHPDYMGMREEKKKQGKLPLFMADMNEESVKRIKEIVDQLISSIILAMDEKTGQKVSAWLHEPSIFLDNG